MYFQVLVGRCGMPNSRRNRECGYSERKRTHNPERQPECDAADPALAGAVQLHQAVR